MSNFNITMVALLTLLLAGCGGSSGGGGGDDDNTVVVTTDFDGTRPSLDNLYSSELVTALEDIGLNFNFGDQPPNIEGTFRIDPRVIQATSVPNDTVTNFVDTEVTFSNQNNGALTVDFLEIEDQGDLTGTAVGSGSFISGSGQAFTVYLQTELTVNGLVAQSTTTISGVATPSGIENIQQAIFILDNGGNDQVFIGNNTGRLFTDSDGLAQAISTNATLDSHIIANDQVGGFASPLAQ